MPCYPRHTELPAPSAEAAAHGGGHAAHEPHAGHDRHAGHNVEMFRARFWVSLVLTIPTVIWGHMLPSALGWEPPAIPGAALLPPVLGTAVFVYGGGVFVQGALRELKDRLPG